MLQSTYFKVEEFACHSGEPYPAAWVDDRLQMLCVVLDAVRSSWGGPLLVISGYRTPAYNLRIKGAPLSQHVQGRAADIAPKNATPELVRRLFDNVRGLINDNKLTLLGGMGLYPSWLHIDTRPKPPSGHLARWDGVGVGSEVT